MVIVIVNIYIIIVIFSVSNISIIIRTTIIVAAPGNLRPSRAGPSQITGVQKNMCIYIYIYVYVYIHILLRAYLEPTRRCRKLAEWPSLRSLSETLPGN